MGDRALALERLDRLQERIETLAGQQRCPDAAELSVLVDKGLQIARELLMAVLEEEHRPYDLSADLLELWKSLVRGAPHWNTIRDNCRELVYYRNCLDMKQMDALPHGPEKMLVHTLRHLYLYLRSHMEQSLEEKS